MRVLSVFLLSNLLAITASAAEIIDEQGLANDEALFMRMLNKLHSDLDTKRRQFEAMDIFLSRKSRAKEKFQEFTSKKYSVSLNADKVSSNWEAGATTVTINCAVPLLMPRSSKVKRQHTINFPSDIRKSREYTAFPQAFKINIKFQITDEGYGLVSAMEIRYRDQAVYSRGI